MSLDIAQAGDLALALSPARVMEASGFTLDPWQREILDSTAKRKAILAARQAGKSEVMVALALHRAAFYPDSNIGIIAQGLRTSAKLLRRIRRAVEGGNGRAPAVPGLRSTNEAATVLELSNGSTISAWPGGAGTTIRGDSLHMLIVDESAFVHPEVFAAATPMLAMTGGPMLIASTPGHASGLFFEVMTADEDSALAAEWERYRVPASQIDRYAPGYLDAERATLGERRYNIEYELEWMNDVDAVFTAEEISRYFDRIPDQLDGEGPLPEDTPTSLSSWFRNSVALSPL